MKQLEFIKFLEDKCNIILTKEQEQVVFTINGPLAVIAVPGSGKTTALICRTANLILNHKVNPAKILALTFSRASADDMETRFSEKFGQVIQKINKFATIHSFSYNVIRNYAFERNIKYTIIENNLSNVNKHSIIRNLYKKYNNGEFTTDDKLEEITNFIGFLKNMMIPEGSIDKLYSKEFPTTNFMAIYKDYESIKKENLYIDFDDMLQLSYSILSSNSKLLQTYIDIYDYIEIDESQDVSKIQHEIIKLIMGKKYNVCLVGDPDQSIYSWRGSYPETLLRFKENYNSHAQVLFMSQNFRSTKNIVSVANKFIKNNKDRFDINVFTNNMEGEEISLINVENNDEQASFIVDKIKKEKNLKECAVLFRNNITSLSIINRLLKEEIPFYIKDPPSIFFNHWVLKDILNIIRLAYNLSDIEAFEKIYFKIKSFTKKTEVTQLYLKLRDDENIFECLSRISVNEHLKIRYKEFINKFSELKEFEPSQCIRFIRYELDYDEYIEKFAKKYKYNMNNINIIINILEEICENIKSINELEIEVGSLKEKIKNSRKMKGENAVTLTTMHSAKGLEFNKVFIMDFVESVIPAPTEIVDKEKELSHIEEERRLAYVAITRARHNLYILYPQKSNNPSIFYKELDSIIYNDNNAKKPVKIEVKASSNVKRALREGVHIKHKSYGKGSIIKKEADIIAILFEDTNKVHCLSSETCIRSNLIEILES